MESNSASATFRVPIDPSKLVPVDEAALTFGRLPPDYMVADSFRGSFSAAAGSPGFTFWRSVHAGQPMDIQYELESNSFEATGTISEINFSCLTDEKVEGTYRVSVEYSRLVKAAGP